jgi:hypothetical protein
MANKQFRMEVSRHGDMSLWRVAVKGELDVFGFIRDDPTHTKGEAAARAWAKSYAANADSEPVWQWNPAQLPLTPNVTPPPPEWTHDEEVALMLAQLGRRGSANSCEVRVEIVPFGHVATIDPDTNEESPIEQYSAEIMKQNRAGSTSILQAITTRNQARALVAAGALIDGQFLAVLNS